MLTWYRQALPTVSRLTYESMFDATVLYNVVSLSHACMVWFT